MQKAAIFAPFAVSNKTGKRSYFHFHLESERERIPPIIGIIPNTACTSQLATVPVEQLQRNITLQKILLLGKPPECSFIGFANVGYSPTPRQHF